MNRSIIGSGDKILDWGVIIAAGILFFRTADILSYFSPQILNDILGFDVSFMYGIVCALLVEGLALAIHFNRRAIRSGEAQVVKWVLLSISGLCQVFDGFVVTNTLAQQSDTMKAVFSYGVPLIPLTIMIMVFGIGQLPELDIMDRSDKEPFIGLKGTWNRLTNGEKQFVSPPQLPQQTNFELPPTEPSSNNHQKDEMANPTTGEQK
jgi:hypothetical protein